MQQVHAASFSDNRNVIIVEMVEQRGAYEHLVEHVPEVAHLPGTAIVVGPRRTRSPIAEMRPHRVVEELATLPAHCPRFLSSNPTAHHCVQAISAADAGLKRIHVQIANNYRASMP